MNNLIKSTGSKILKDQFKKDKAQHLARKQPETQTRDDQEEEMISKTSKHQTHTTASKQISPKFYHILNPNLNESEFLKDQSKYLDCKQLSLKNLIVFLLLLLLTMFAVYKIVEEIYQIQHPQSIMTKKMNEGRLSMQKESSLGQKQQSKVQAKIVGLTQNALKNIDPALNRLQLTEKRFEQTIETNNLQKYQKLTELHSSDQLQKQNPNNPQHNQQNSKTKSLENQDSKRSDDLDSALKQKEQDIEAILKNDNHQNINNFQKNQQNNQKDHQQSFVPSYNAKIPNTDNKHIQISVNHINKNPIIENSNHYVWSSYGNGPIGKANITKDQAIKWKSFVKMVQLPLDLPIESDSMLKDEYQYFQKKYQISQYQELPICVVIPSYNNAQNSRYKVNIQSILQQNYSNYHIVFIDDKSDDRTGQLVKEYVSSFEPKYQQKVKVIINQQRKMAMPNLRYAALHQCQQNQLFIIIDGDDSLIGRQVFKMFSAVMQKRDLWVMWTNFLSPKGSIGYSRQYASGQRQSNNYRKAGFVMSHLRAYYTKLFRLIKEQDLKDENGEYFHAANDVAIGIPILQMAHLHTAYVPEISYFYNMNTGLNNHRVRLKEQKSNDKKIRKKPKYAALPSLNFNHDQTETQLPSLDDKSQKKSDMQQMESSLHKNINKA